MIRRILPVFNNRHRDVDHKTISECEQDVEASMTESDFN
jgi:hypothetical protein